MSTRRFAARIASHHVLTVPVEGYSDNGSDLGRFVYFDPGVWLGFSPIGLLAIKTKPIANSFACYSQLLGLGLPLGCLPLGAGPPPGERQGVKLSDIGINYNLSVVLSRYRLVILARGRVGSTSATTLASQ